MPPGEMAASATGCGVEPASLATDHLIVKPHNPTSPMTENDKKLLEQARKIKRYDYYLVDDLIPLAETPEARMELHEIKRQLYDLVLDTI